MKSSRTLWGIAALVLVVGLLGTPAVYQFLGWRDKSRDAKAKQATLDASRAELGQLQDEQRDARQAAQKELEPARSAEQELTRNYQAALQKVRKDIEEKDFFVRL